MKKRLKKMSLNRETLRQLDAIDFRQVAGGVSQVPQCPPSYHFDTCYTCVDTCFDTMYASCDYTCAC